jgi:hypothetical protein
MVYADVYEEVGIWAIKLRLLTKSGYTLWASKADDDLLLTVGRNLILFKKPESIARYMTSESPTNLSDLPGYIKLSQIFNRPNFDWQNFEYDEDFNLPKIANLLTQPDWYKAGIKTCAKVLNAFNIIWDIAVSIDDVWIIDNFKAKTLVGDFLDTLTFLEERELPTLQNFNLPLITAVYNEGLTKIDQKTLIYS